MAERPLTIARLCASVMAVVTICCAPLPANQGGGDDLAAIESICARSLQQLDDLIATREAAGQTPTETMVEVKALRAAAAELYVDGENDLALEFIDQAFVLLGIRK